MYRRYGDVVSCIWEQTTVLMVGTAAAESEAGEQDAGGTRVTGMEDRVGLQSGHMLYHPHSDSPASGLCSAG